MSHTYLTANVYCRRLFGGKVYKLALSAATGCPNRDGTVSVGGCVFCSAGGSGDFAASVALPVSRQIEEAKQILGTKGEGPKYIAYFQSYTGTYPWHDSVELLGSYYLDWIKEGKMTVNQIQNLGDIINGTLPGRQSDDEIILFGQGGQPVYDVAWGKQIFDNAVKMGLGVKLNLWETPYMH